MSHQLLNKYSKKENISTYWYNKSSDLRASAGVIWYAMNNEDSEEIVQKIRLGRGFNLGITCWQTYFMLCGLTLELLFKAILASKKKSIPFSHDLCHLAKEATVNYTEKELELLSILRNYIEWKGKYPTSKKYEVYENYYILYDKYFWIPTKKTGNLEIKSQRNHFTWKNFTDIWRRANEVFWSIIHRK